MSILNEFNLEGKVAVVTAGGGILGGAIACGLGEAGATVVIADIQLEKAAEVADRISEAGGKALAVVMDVFDRESIEAAAQYVMESLGSIDILVNGVGGNSPKATTNAEQSFFDIPADAIKWVSDLNFVHGVLIPTQVFAKHMLSNEDGASIINISSMNAFRPLTRIVSYSAAKAAVNNFTQWLAVHLAQEYGPKLRVNAIAPGFFLTDQNRYLLVDAETGQPTARGGQILSHTPQGRYGAPEDLAGATVFLASDAARFVTGIIVPIDGGFSAYSGV